MNIREIEILNPQETSRGEAFSLWMTSPMPMVTLVKTLDVTKIVRYAHRHKLSFNMLLCWCIGRAASRIPEFYMLPKGDSICRYSQLGINVIVKNAKGGINSCDIAFNEELSSFNADYQRLTQQTATECKSVFREDLMIVGTSAITATELDCIVNQYTDKFFNPMVMWGKYRKGLIRTTLPISFQFHHVQMDGAHAGTFLANLQKAIDGIDN